MKARRDAAHELAAAQRDRAGHHGRRTSGGAAHGGAEDSRRCSRSWLRSSRPAGVRDCASGPQRLGSWFGWDSRQASCRPARRSVTGQSAASGSARHAGGPGFRLRLSRPFRTDTEFADCRTRPCTGSCTGLGDRGEGATSDDGRLRQPRSRSGKVLKLSRSMGGTPAASWPTAGPPRRVRRAARAVAGGTFRPPSISDSETGLPFARALGPLGSNLVHGRPPGGPGPGRARDLNG